MSVQPGPTDKRYAANGVSTIYTVPFLVIEAGDLNVYLNDVLMTSGYAHTGIGEPSSTLTFTTPPLGDLYLLLDVPFQRLTDYQENGDLLADTLNRDFDRIWQALKQLYGWTIRTLRLGTFDIDGSGWYRAKGNGIRDLNDPEQPQDAATKHSVEAYVSEILETGQGPINNAANVFYFDPYGTLRVVQDMSGPNGGRLVGHRDRDLGRKAEEVISIQDFAGAVDDYNGTTGTNIFPAIQRILSEYPGGAIVKLPKTNTGRYLLNGTMFSNLNGFVFDPDPGVSIHQIGIPSPMIAKGVRVTRQLPIRLASQGYTFYLGPRAYGDVVEKPSFMGWGDGEDPKLLSVNQNFATNSRIAWPDGPVTTATPATVAPDGIVYQPVPFNAFVLTSRAVRPGSQINAYLAVPAYGGELIAGVITDNGFSIVRQNAVGGPVQIAVKSGSSPLVESPAITTPITAMDNYRMAFGLVSVRVHSPISYSLLINDVEVVRVKDAGGVILQAGFGGGFSTNNESLTVAGMSIAQNVRTMGVQPLSIVVVGDSITDPEVPCSWFDYTRQYITGVGGVQVSRTMNLAVSGENSNAQRARLVAANISGYDYCLIQVGTNDIQQGFNPSTLISNLGLMIDKCIANRVTPIIGLPPMFYGTAEAAPYGNVGQNTVNNTGGSPTRATVLRYLASRNVAYSPTLANMGAIIASLLGDPSLDPVAMDNIHPTAFGRMLIGYANAKSLLGQIQPRISKTVAGRAVPVAWAGAGFGTTTLPTYSIQENLFGPSGALSTPSTTITDGTVFLTVPSMFAPPQQENFVVPVAGVSGTPSGFASVIVSTAGVFTVYTAPVGTRYLYLGSIRYAIGE